MKRYITALFVLGFSLCFFIFSTLFLLSCEIKAEFEKNGKAYYTRSKCVKWVNTSSIEYHYGFNPFSGQIDWHIGPVYSCECVEWVKDTIEIK